MNKMVKYLPQENPKKLKKATCKLIPGKQEIIRKGSRRKNTDRPKRRARLI